MLTYIIKNGSWVFVGNVLLAVFAFITTAILAHILPKETFGTYRFLLTVIPLLAVFTLPDMGVSITRAVAKNLPVDILEVVKEKVKFGFFASILSLSAAGFYFWQDNEDLARLFIITAFFIPLFDVFLVYTNALYGRKKFKQATVYLVASRLMAMLIMIATAFLTKNILLIALAYFIGQVTVQTFWFFKVRKKEGFNIPRTDNSILEYGKHLTVIGAIAVIVASLDKLVVWHYFGAEALALYTVALLVAWEGGRMIESLSVVLLPFFSEAKDHGHLKSLIQHLPLLVTILLLGSIITVFLMPYLLNAFFPNYTAALNLARISCILLILLPLNSSLYRYLVAVMSKRAMIYLQLLKMSIFLVVFFLIHDHFGLLSALLALISSELIATVYLLQITVSRVYYK